MHGTVGKTSYPCSLAVVTEGVVEDEVDHKSPRPENEDKIPDKLGNEERALFESTLPLIEAVSTLACSPRSNTESGVVEGVSSILKRMLSLIQKMIYVCYSYTRVLSNNCEETVILTIENSYSSNHLVSF